MNKVTLSESTEKALNEAIEASPHSGKNLDEFFRFLANFYVTEQEGKQETRQMEEATDLAAERQAELRQKLRTERQGSRKGDSSSRAKRLSELRQRAEKASEKDGIQHNGEGDTVGEYLDKKERARDWVGLPSTVDDE